MLKFLDKSNLKSKKIYTSHLRKSLETHLTFTISTAFGIINYFCLIKKCFKSHFCFNYCQDLKTKSRSNQPHNLGSQAVATRFNSFINAFNISNEIIFLPKKSLNMGNTLQHRHYYYLDSKNLIFVTSNLYKYTQKKIYFVWF